jgi:hypothetical protein
LRVVSQDHIHALAGQVQGGALAQSAAAAGDEGNALGSGGGTHGISLKSDWSNLAMGPSLLIADAQIKPSPANALFNKLKQ